MPEHLSPELIELRDRVRDFVDHDLHPLETGLEPGTHLPDDIVRQVRERSKALGLFGMTQPAEFGGTEAGPLAMTVARETLAAGNTPFARYVFGPDPGLLRRAEGDLHTRFRQPVLAGEKRWAFAFTEPSGADAPQKPTWAVHDGDALVVTGRKSYVSGGEFADIYATLVNVEETEAGPGGGAMLLIERDTPGLTIGRVFRSTEGSGHVELSFEAARVPLANVLGTIGEGMPRAMGNIGEERMAMAAEATGMALWAVQFVTEHITGGHRAGQRLGDREGVRLRYADLRIDTYAARATLYRTARLAESGADVMNEGSAAKVFCTDAATRVIDGAIQLVGGQALVQGHPLELLYRRIRSMRLGGGASDILRLGVARGVIEFQSGVL